MIQKNSDIVSFIGETMPQNNDDRLWMSSPLFYDVQRTLESQKWIPVASTL